MSVPLGSLPFPFPSPFPRNAVETLHEPLCFSRKQLSIEVLLGSGYGHDSAANESRVSIQEAHRSVFASRRCCKRQPRVV
jgi:hypothetical protein